MVSVTVHSAHLRSLLDFYENLSWLFPQPLICLFYLLCYKMHVTSSALNGKLKKQNSKECPA
jgi:hypothetical protein